MNKFFSVIFLGLILAVSTVAAKADETDEVTYKKDSVLLTEIQPLDVIYGKDDAPVTMIEYASLSCSHCANFHKNVVPTLEEQFIDTGKLRLIYRHYPLNPPALRAAQLVACVDDTDKKHKFIDALFKSQSEWAYKSSEKDFLDKIKLLADIGGISTDEFDKCASDKDLEDKILAGQLKAGQELGVNSTPSLFINGEAFAKMKDVETITTTLNTVLKDLGK